ncbi:MAG: beta-propeller fold lactonase family protein, partial [Bacteroidota bacterium]
IWEYDFMEGHPVLKDSMVAGAPWPEDSISITGLAATQEQLMAVTKEDSALYIFNRQTHQLDKRIPLGNEAYTCLLSPDQKTLYISIWGDDRIACLDVATQQMTAQIPTGSHPNDMVLTDDGTRLFVANANDNSVTVIDVTTQKVLETLSTSLYPDAPAGSTTNGVALSDDEEYLYVANADNNCLAVFEVEEKGQSKSLGFIPTGWYPTCVRTIGERIYVANGKGSQSFPNPKGPNPYERRTDSTEYIGSLLEGSLSIIEIPSEDTLRLYTSLTFENSPYNKEIEQNAKVPEGNPIPSKVGDPSPIKYVFYVIKENRTYDQILGDMPKGNGDPSLCIFPDSVTPNQHKLAREFVLLDHFFVDAEVSADGHNWTNAAYANDYVEKTWPTSYGRRGGIYDYEGRREIAWPDEGFIWDYCQRAGVPYRSYGEFVWAGKVNYESLKGHVDLDFPSYNLRVKDMDRYAKWEADFDSLLVLDAVPQFSVIRLGNDHTAGGRAGYPTPAAMVADNDLAVGKLVEHISHSKIWKESAIFILEDDAQNGPDHVDAHRSIAFIASPYTRRQHHETTMYSTCSMLRTMELILGLPPMSQYDAAATPMWACFTSNPDFTPYDVLPNQIPLDEMNRAPQALSDETLKWDLTREDAAPDIPFNRNIWRTVRGIDSEMPAPIRSAFIQTEAEEEER